MTSYCVACNMLHCAATATAVSESKPSQAGPAAVSSRYDMDIDACLGDIRAGIDEAAATEDPYHFRHDRLHRRNGVEYVELDGPLGQHPNLPHAAAGPCWRGMCRGRMRAMARSP